jgi:hypothetical protein
MMSMAAETNNERLIARYLLGELPEEQQVEIEDRAFADKDYLASITAVENDLIDEYVREELSEADRRNFENRFLASAERRKRVEFARALVNVTVVKKPDRAPAAISWRDSLEAFFAGFNPFGKFALAAMTLLVMAGGAWLLIKTLPQRSQLTQLQAENQSRQSERQALEQQIEAERKRNEELAARLNQEKQQREQSDEALRQLSEARDTSTPAPRPVIASLTLLPGISRGGGEKPSLVLPENTQLVRLRIGIDAEEQYKTFAAELRTTAGRQIWTKENLTARSGRRARSISVIVPATALKPGEYELKLSGMKEAGGTEDVGFYYFDVRK